MPFFLLNELPTKVNEPHLLETTGFEAPVNRLRPSPVSRNMVHRTRVATREGQLLAYVDRGIIRREHCWTFLEEWVERSPLRKMVDSRHERHRIIMRSFMYHCERLHRDRTPEGSLDLAQS